jgi:hypothetical protein
MRRFSSLALVAAFVLATMLVVPPSRVAATPVGDTDALYFLYGRVFPDPHGCVRGLATKSPYAKGKVCAGQFLQFSELWSGLRYLDSKFPSFVQLYELPVQSAGLPTNTLERSRAPLYAVRVTDERVTAAKRKFAFSLSIHGIERAGVEGGTRAIEDLVTWGSSEPGRPILGETLADSTLTVGEVLSKSELWFFYPNPDGWLRGDVSRGGLVYQRYNGNGVDLNRDWPTRGYTFRPYTPASEPESKGFSEFFKNGPPSTSPGTWTGGADLHGMLHAIAFTFTMMPSGEFDYARNKSIVNAVRRIQQDAFPRLSWFPLIRPYDQTPTTTRPHAQQWGTVWDTIAYTTTGSLGDWMGNPIGLDAYVGIDNEMWVSHLAPNNAFDPDLEQAHIDGNKGLIYAQIEAAFRDAPARTFPLNGRAAYLDHGRTFSHPGSPSSGDVSGGRPPQGALQADLLSTGTADVTYEFDVKGRLDGFYNGGLTAQVTFTNLQAISAGAVTAVFVERLGDEHGGAKKWEVVNQDFNQASTYLQAGMTVNVNSPEPARYRVRLSGSPPGVHRVKITFTTGPSWPDPGQAPFNVTNTKFFRDLDRYLPAGGGFARVTPADVLAGVDLSGYDTLVLANEPLPGWTDPAPTGAAQSPIKFEMVGPAETGTYEFTVGKSFNNVSMVVDVRWDIPSDYDLYVDREASPGSWVEIGSSLDFINNGERVEISGFFPGLYRARLVNYAGIPQQLHGHVEFSNTGITPPTYAATLTTAQRDAYYAALRAFVERGGNLVLTDGAARALTYLGIGTTDDVRPLLVYAPFIGFTTDGTNATYDDPLARNVNQPGAAEGPNHRRQTVEPVPLGYSIQDDNGNNKAHSFTWTVAPGPWRAAGGRVVGTAAGGVALGEIPLGLGRIRFAGALLPDPEIRYDHPYGLSNYALTYTGWQVFENLVQWQRPLPDLAISTADIALSSERIVSGDPVTITATVHNIGTAPATNVPVRFTDNGTQIGTIQTVANVPAGGTGTASVVWATNGLSGDRTIAVTADPNNLTKELRKDNNTASRVVTVLRNQVQNGDFEQSTSGTAPTSWQPAGATTYARSSAGNHYVTAAPGGSWTSDPIAVTPGRSYGVAALNRGGTLTVEQLSATGAVLSALNNVTSFKALAGVAQVRVKLLGGLTGAATFDDVRLWEE